MKVPGHTVTIDSLDFYPVSKISLSANDFTDTVIQLKLYEGDYRFIKDSSKMYPLFVTNKGNDSVYLLTKILPSLTNDTVIIATIKYQAFDKKLQIPASKEEFSLRNINFPLSTIKSFEVESNYYYKKNSVYKR